MYVFRQVPMSGGPNPSNAFKNLTLDFRKLCSRLLRDSIYLEKTEYKTTMASERFEIALQYDIDRTDRSAGTREFAYRVFGSLGK